VPVSSTLRLYLDKWRLKAGEGTWLFPSPAGLRWDADNFSSDLRAANDKAKLAWGCLDFRHTFGSQLAMKGESLYKISTLMGNSPEICRRHYAALIPEALGDSVEFEDSPSQDVLARAAASA
jgi:integrase